MYHALFKSKVRRATVTQNELHYEGSSAIDENLLDAANLVENEQIHIWNINNGERGSGMISIIGAAARRASVGDLIIAAFAQVHGDQVTTHEPQQVFVDDKNKQTELRHKAPTQHR